MGNCNANCCRSKDSNKVGAENSNNNNQAKKRIVMANRRSQVAFESSSSTNPRIKNKVERWTGTKILSRNSNIEEEGSAPLSKVGSLGIKKPGKFIKLGSQASKNDEKEEKEEKGHKLVKSEESKSTFCNKSTQVSLDSDKEDLSKREQTVSTTSVSCQTDDSLLFGYLVQQRRKYETMSSALQFMMDSSPKWENSESPQNQQQTSGGEKNRNCSLKSRNSIFSPEQLKFVKKSLNDVMRGSPRPNAVEIQNLTQSLSQNQMSSRRLIETMEGQPGQRKSLLRRNISTDAVNRVKYIDQKHRRRGSISVKEFGRVMINHKNRSERLIKMKKGSPNPANQKNSKKKNFENLIKFYNPRVRSLNKQLTEGMVSNRGSQFLAPLSLDGPEENSDGNDNKSLNLRTKRDGGGSCVTISRKSAEKRELGKDKAMCSSRRVMRNT